MWIQLPVWRGADLTRRQRAAWIAGFALMALAIGPGLIGQLQLAWQQHCLDRKLRALEQMYSELLKEQERLLSDPVYVEGLTRSTFKLAKPGELVVPLATSSSKSH